MNPVALLLLGLTALPQEPAAEPVRFPEPERSLLQGALREWISALEADPRRQIGTVGQFLLDTVEVAARALPSPEFDQLESRLRVAISLCQRAAEEAGRQRIRDRGRELSASFEALEAALGQDPLQAVGALSRLLEEAMRLPALAPGSRSTGISRRLRQAYSLRVPEVVPPDRPRPLLVLLGPPAALETLERALPPPFLEDYLLLRTDLSGLPLDRIPDAGRLRLVDALSEVFRTCAVDRDRILLVGAEGGRDAAAVLTALLPHFFQGTALLGNQESAPAEGVRTEPAWLVRCEGNLGRPELTPVHRGGDPALAFEWLAGLPPRNAYPEVVEFDFLVPGAGRAFWVQGMAFDPVEHLKRPATIRVQADRESNTLRIEAQSVHSVDLYLNDVILDLDRPIFIEHLGSGRTYRFQARRSISALLENFARNPDPGSVYPAMIRGLDLPAESRP
ncbi:MAG: hypothetical protein ISR76_07395 [Planctomycetes bacterium]|nr:hypothetical protein [Planctomycetota bacterium]MBL7008807.1 hypothetical protein [Planctomycetota bacterium]